LREKASKKNNFFSFFMRGWLGDVLLGFFDFLLDTRSSGGVVLSKDKVAWIRSFKIKVEKIKER